MIDIFFCGSIKARASDDSPVMADSNESNKER
jgi:hypothetical protein